jgi:hypothetical protein
MSARPFGTKKIPNSIRQIMPVNILRYIVKSPFLEIRELSSWNGKAFLMPNRIEDEHPERNVISMT